ncbi:MAG: hypothetical protein AAGF74_10055 [Pseudomonadota bacterium]
MSLAFVAFFYLIVALQVASGFPPLYENNKDSLEAEIKSLLPFGFALILLMVAATLVTEVFLLFGLVSAWMGWRVRKSVQVRTNGPRSWVLNPLTIGALNRWPMLAFDAWTIGMVGLTGALIFISS